MTYKLIKEYKSSSILFRLQLYNSDLLREVRENGVVIAKDIGKGINDMFVSKLFNTPAGKCDVQMFFKNKNGDGIFTFTAYPMIKFEIINHNANDLQALIYITKDFALQLHSFSGGNSMEYVITQLQQKRTMLLRKDEYINKNSEIKRVKEF